jgi:PAS domain S-box-containing protein
LLQMAARRWLRIVGQVVGGLILVFAGAVLSEWVFRLDLGIDSIFFAHRLVDWHLPFPGRFSFNSAIGFCAAGISLLTLRKRSGLPVSEVCSALILLLSYLSVVGYLYSVPAFYSTGNVMALPTAILFGILSFALLAAGNGPLLNVLLSPYAGGIVARPILSTILVLMPLLGWLEIWARHHGLVNREIGVALLVLVTVLIFAGITIRTSVTLTRLDRTRLQSDSALRVSERQLAKSLEEANLNIKRLQLIQETVNAGTWEFDPETGISHWGPGISALWGLPATDHEIPLDDFSRRIYPEDRDRVSHVVEKALQSGDNYDVEFRVVWPDQSVHWLAARGAVLRSPEGKPARVIGIALEVTQRHQTEKALRDSEKLAATGRLAATIAHEINNPLEAVVNLIYLAKNAESLDTATRQLLEGADLELGRVSHMVRQTLGFYRETSNPVWIDLAATVDQIVSLYQNKVQRKAIQLDVRTEPARVFGLEGELRQVISNFMANAIDAVEFNGRISVRVRTGKRGINITIADNGHGILSEHRSRIFQPFFTTKKDFGTGLGLWVSKGIIEKHQGRVRVRSRTGQSSGTVFSIQLPIEAKAPSAQSASMMAS